MIITKDFVALNNPKTGSTYVRSVIKSIYGKPANNLFKKVTRKLGLYKDDFVELMLPNLQFPDRPNNQHGCYSQIPEKYLDRPIFSVIRNPYDKFLSAYEYRYWEKHPPKDEKFMAENIKEFSQLTLDEYVLMLQHNSKVSLGNDNPHEIGLQTIQFIRLFFKNPEEALPKANPEYFESRAYKQDIAQVSFLRQENLTEDLHNLFRDYGMSQEHLDIVKNHKKVNVNKTRAGDSSRLWTERALDHVQYRERFLHLMLSDLGFDYPAPKLKSAVS